MHSLDEASRVRWTSFGEWAFALVERLEHPLPINEVSSAHDRPNRQRMVTVPRLPEQDRFEL